MFSSIYDDSSVSLQYTISSTSQSGRSLLAILEGKIKTFFVASDPIMAGPPTSMNEFISPMRQFLEECLSLWCSAQVFDSNRVPLGEVSLLKVLSEKLI